MIDKDYSLREAEASDLPAIADLFIRHDYWAKDLASVRWKYSDNPDGPARVFVAADSDSRIVGLVAYLPRLFTGAETGTFPVMHTVDVFVAEELRGKGVYSKIDQYARSHMNVPRIGFPNKLSIGFGLRSVWYILARLDRWVFPVAVGPLIAKKSSGRVASLANALSKAYAFLWLFRCPGDLKMKRVTRFSEDLALDLRQTHGIRSAEYLNWRFVDNPIRTFSVYEFFEGEERIGYCAYERVDSSAEILDCVTRRRKAHCLRLLVEHCRSQCITHLSFSGVGLRLRRFGFFRLRSPRTCTAANVPKGKWMITMCDSDW